ncbi:MAG: orotidine-5'-phosphate decarboxylase [Gemmatales bacterium]|nr:orotidine-5'-phosphate decarboxylase [Gemmatales bacterium]MCS7160775.1 orotidine-5'-phosphate decarboxylase [Gemmatales bacterium]MDW8175976.1 orotidine-5'-phosphate decarboxylase [Gemmatales bacterium]MDW8222487.1 orotidine-5'-phosphate decarboxylase [Gemmatales bacterium]
MHFSDLLLDTVLRYRTPLCLGLDPRWELLPLSLRQRYPESFQGKARAYEEFCARILALAEGHCGVVKVQSAFFEACGPAGMEALHQVVQMAKRRRYLVILDAKRADIATTTEAYAEALYCVYGADAVTVNPYLGRESLEPFVTLARVLKRGVFVLVRTSNLGAKDYQDLDCGGKKLYEHVAEHVEQWARETKGVSGFGAIGAVAGATQPEIVIHLRQLMPSTIFLIPGYGAQGGVAEFLRPVFDAQGRGAIVNAARSILYASPVDAADWERYVERALLTAKDELARVAGLIQ